jgi:excisionase family DNA binding protein
LCHAKPTGRPSDGMGDDGVPPRFLTLADVAEVLNTSVPQVYALVRSNKLRAIKIGGRGQWRVEVSELEAFIQRMYQETEQFVATHPFGRSEELPEDEEGSPAAH